ncbi:hypothetical protein TGAM01_v209175 [Trichoderma gamsii]|uniref:AB hydrolase-1 domain-containing protein n=1 Tax=Trichoderma gamsii TaxID=398673 RepID=A0A2P4ZC98_9HYPO|nr:hypothetical protein TGAM01_v209175 [Trichoderma gamsii]PON21919.1 hypothetical protein TGAM01_v209175 [Trichoderma gamsii]
MMRIYRRTYAEWADNVAQVVKALGISQIDLFGFSMGGFAAQMAALNYPTLVRKLILAGTGPSAGEGIEGGDSAAFGRLAAASNDEEEHGGFLEAFYSLTPTKQTLGDKWWKRMTTARSNRSDYVGPEGTKAQIDAVLRWSNREHASEGSYDCLHEIKIPVLVANGDNDILIPTVNSWVMFKRLTNADAHLHLYPDVGHGFLNEYAAMLEYFPTNTEYQQILTSDYDIGCERRIFDIDWYPSLADPRLELTTLGLKSNSDNAAILAPCRKTHPSEADKDEREIPRDVIVLANGFEVSRWFHPLTVVGVNGQNLDSVFDSRGGPQMYKGSALNGFPTCFALFDPNSFSGLSSVIFGLENQITMLFSESVHYCNLRRLEKYGLE